MTPAAMVDTFYMPIPGEELNMTDTELEILRIGLRCMALSSKVRGLICMKQTGKADEVAAELEREAEQLHYLTTRLNLTSRSDEELALEGAIKVLMDSGDLELDDEPPFAAHNGVEGDLLSEGDK